MLLLTRMEAMTIQSALEAALDQCAFDHETIEEAIVIVNAILEQDDHSTIKKLLEDNADD